MRGQALKLMALGVCALPLLLGGCAVKKTERLPVGQILPLQSATREELLARLERQAEAVTSINAEAELIPSTGSAYSGVIEQYHDVRAFVLAERRPAGQSNHRQIRLIGQAPIMRKTVFDMVADETQFRILLPTKNKFIVGPTDLARRSDKPIENLRPQHLLEALFPAAPRPSPLVMLLLEENEFSGRRYYALTEVTAVEDLPGHAYGVWHVGRKWWFDRADLSLVRAQRFEPDGRLVADIRYGGWRQADGVPYPHEIELVRPHEDYRLKLLIKNLSLNQPLPPERFRLEPPAGVEVVELKSDPETREERP